MNKFITPLIAILLAGCSQIKISPQGEQVAIPTNTADISNTCKILGSVDGYGSSEEEVQFDLRHNAKTKLNANTLVITVVESFHQSVRMRNYIRRPALTRSKFTHEYAYENGFVLHATGMAYRCKLTASAK